MGEVLNHANYVVFAAKHYRNTECVSDEEFFGDLKRINYIKKLFKKYKESGEIKERLVINHLIVMNNVFGSEITVKLLFFKLTGYYSYLKPFLDFLGYLPEKVEDIGFPPKSINTTEITECPVIVARLREI